MSRLASEMPNLIHYDQVGFFKSREARDRVIRVLNILHFSQERSIPLMLLSTDAEKALDRVSWELLAETLRALEFGEHMMAWI